jgi:glucose/arabinose dehydrogenase
VIRRSALVLLTGLAVAPAAHAATLEQVGSFSSPVSVAGAPGDPHRVYVVERGGVIRELLDGVEQATPFLDIHVRVRSGGEQGLLSMAIDPADQTHVFVYYTSEPEGDIQIDRYTVATADTVDPNTRAPIVTIPHSVEENHNGGQLQFGPDGKLYAATGDGGGGGDQHHNAQNLTVTDSDSTPLLGKLLRIDPDGSAPADNPFPSAPLVWSLGLRNPWRFSFDRLTGDLTIGDVGQDLWEEIDFAPAPGAGKGVNYGWNMREGLHAYTNPTDTPGPNCTPCPDPVLEHSHSSGWYAIVGGYVVRDPAVPELAGRYLYGDNAKGDLYAATLSATGASGDGPTGLHVADLSGFGEDGTGRVYAASLDGPVYRLVGDPAGPGSGPGPGAGGNPAPGGSADTTAPKVTLLVARRQHVLRAKRFVAKVSCNERCVLRVGAKRARTRHVTAAAGARLRLVLRPSRTALRLWRRAVRRHHHVVIRIRARATDAAGNATTRSARVRVLR